MYRGETVPFGKTGLDDDLTLNIGLPARAAKESHEGDNVESSQHRTVSIG